jgi:hypothetical protein
MAWSKTAEWVTDTEQGSFACWWFDECSIGNPPPPGQGAGGPGSAPGGAGGPGHSDPGGDAGASSSSSNPSAAPSEPGAPPWGQWAANQQRQKQQQGSPTALATIAEIVDSHNDRPWHPQKGSRISTTVPTGARAPTATLNGSDRHSANNVSVLNPQPSTLIPSVSANVAALFESTIERLRSLEDAVAATPPPRARPLWVLRPVRGGRSKLTSEGRVSNDTKIFLEPVSPPTANFKFAIFSIDTPIIIPPIQGGIPMSIFYMEGHFQPEANVRGDANLRFTGSQLIASLDQFSDQYPLLVIDLANKANFVWPGTTPLPPAAAYPFDTSSSSTLCQMAGLAWYRGASLLNQGKISDEEFSPAGVLVCGGCATHIKSPSIAQMIHLY